MKKPSLVLLCALALGVGVSLAWTPTVPDTILLPDSLGPLRPGYHLAFGSSTDNIYVASESSDIIVVDGNTFQRIKRINTGTPVGGALLVSKHNRLYVSHPSQGRVGVIDCSTNEVVGSILVGSRPTLLCYSSGSDKLYCGDTIDKTVSVIGCASNALLKVVPVGRSLAAMAYDPTSNKVYAATRDGVLAISCSADSVVAAITAAKRPVSLCVNKRRQKLYAVGPEYQGLDTIYVISTQSDSVIAAMHGVAFRRGRLACNEATDRLYAMRSSDPDRILEFDCSGDTFTRACYIWDDAYSLAIACDTVRDRLYSLTNWGSLIEFDCETFDVVSKVGCAGWGRIIESDPDRRRMLYVYGDSEEAVLLPVDCRYDTTSVVTAVPLCGWRRVMYHNPATSRLYCRWGVTIGGVGVVDERVNSVVKQSFLGEAYYGHEMTYSRHSNKFYFAARKGIGVLDGATDSLLKVIDTKRDPDLSPSWCPDGNKVYSFVDDSTVQIAVVDCNTDSVVRNIAASDIVMRLEYLGDGRMLCYLGESLAVIDSRTDSIPLYAPIGGVGATAHTGDGGKMYVTRRDPDRLEAWDSHSFSLLTTIYWPYYDGRYKSTFLAYADTTKKLYWFVGDDSVLAIDATSDTVTARMATSVSLHGTCLDHTGRYMFCSSPYDSALRVYDTRADSLVGVYSHLPYPYPGCIASNPEQRCIYVGCGDVILVYPDAPPGVEEMPNADVRTTSPGPTVLRGNLHLPLASGVERRASSVLLDATGREVRNLKPGENDVRALAPGVYFVRGPMTEDGRPGDVRKVVLTK
ncbi:YncE family protein [candidate division WOR-3 bacterium]|uniref:YncE family protein n=1 Tax=candidate division WOR-3 bacterium TaxID=2052148 RepID=A0A937XBI6_UNCW3|nr:YncE family protein [candidate division WOR-3 bacterium]